MKIRRRTLAKANAKRYRAKFRRANIDVVKQIEVEEKRHTDLKRELILLEQIRVSLRAYLRMGFKESVTLIATYTDPDEGFFVKLFKC